MISIGDRILCLRKELNLNQKQLADLIGITETSLSRYENNLREPKAEIISRLSKALECSTDYLLARTNNKTPYYKSENESFDYDISFKNYEKVNTKITNRLIAENIIDKKELIPDEALDKILKYGIEATIEILKLEKNKA